MRDAFKPGDRVTWLHRPRGGYGFIEQIAAVVERVTEKRVAIKVFKINGPEPVCVVRWVHPFCLVHKLPAPPRTDDEKE